MDITRLSKDNPLNKNYTKNDPLSFQVFNEKQNAVSGNMRKKQHQENQQKVFGSNLQFTEPESEAVTRNDVMRPPGKSPAAGSPPIRHTRQSRSVTAIKGAPFEKFSSEFQTQLNGTKKFELNENQTFNLKAINESFNTI